MKAGRNVIQIWHLGVLFLMLPAMTQAQFTYTTNNGEITITGYTGNPTTLNIPSTTNGYPVTTIGDNAFLDCFSLTNLTIPDSVTSIGDDGFSGCNVISLAIPNSVTNIGNDAFWACNSLTAINVDTNNPAYSSMNGVLFNQTQSILVDYPEGKAGMCYTIPGGVVSIGINAFANCGNLTNVTVPSSVTSIGGYPEYPFWGCSSLTAINVDTNNPAYVSVAGVVFDKNQTALILCPGGKAGNYMIPNNVIIIGDGAFGDCRSLSEVMVPNTVTSIGQQAFALCISLTNVMIGNSVTNIGDVAFNDCLSLVSLTIPNSVTSIGQQAFLDCGFTNITMGTNVTSIPFEAFYDCANLTSVTIPNSVTNIGNLAFAVCLNLTSVTIPSDVTSIGNNAFYFCNDLSAVYFQGNTPSPSNDLSVFEFDSGNPIAYYLPGTTGWRPTFDGIPTVELLNLSLIVSSTNVAVNFSGVPTCQYTLERSTNLTEGMGWVTISTNTAPGKGRIQAIDSFQDLGIPIPPLPSSVFYRAGYNAQN